MGSSQSLRLKEEAVTIRATETLIEEFKKHVMLVDNAVTGLAYAVDTMTSLCKRFIYQHDDNGSQKALHADERLENTVLKTINDCILDSKTVTVISVKHFFDFIAEMYREQIDNIQDSVKSLEINTYCANQRFEKPVTNSMTECLLRSMNNMKEEIHNLRDILSEKDREIASLIIRENGYIEELKQARDISDKLECDLINERSDLEKSKPVQTLLLDAGLNTKAHQSELKKSQPLQVLEDSNPRCIWRGNDDRVKYSHENVEVGTGDQSKYYYKQTEEVSRQTDNSFTEQTFESMIREIERAKTGEKLFRVANIPLPRFVTVQVYHCQIFNSNSAEEEVLEKMKKELARDNIELKEKRPKSDSIYGNMPLLICHDHFCKSYDLRSQSVEPILQNFKVQKDRIFILVFHNIDESKIDDEIRTAEATPRGIGGMIHFRHTKGALHNTVSNQKALTEVISFVKRTGIIKENYLGTAV